LSFQSHLKELIFKIEGFKFGWYLTFVQFVIYTILASIDTMVVGEYVRRYVFESCCYLPFTFSAQSGFIGSQRRGFFSVSPFLALAREWLI